MLKLESTPYGFVITLTGVLTKEDLEPLANIHTVLQKAPLDLKILFNVSDAEPLMREGREALLDAFFYFIEHGLLRTCVLYSRNTLYLQWKNIHAKAGFESVRYIDVTKVAGHKRISREWLVYGEVDT